MSSSLRKAFDDLDRELTAVTLRPASAIRARANARRYRRAAGVAASIAAVAVAPAAYSALFGSPASAPPAGPDACPTGFTPYQPDPTSRHVRVFMGPETEARHIRAVAEHLESLGLTFTMKDSAAVYEDFKETYACAPDLVKLTKPENLPAATFTITLDHPDQYDQLWHDIGSMIGVDYIVRVPD